ncbi:MAG: hypothetical protein IPP71_00365 [Bacteroidetes bacterium]|nr:hypothetical protein [Bacteroidota bacterium]
MKAIKIFLCSIFWMITIVGHSQYWSQMNAHIWGSSSLDVIDNKLYLCGIDTVTLGSTSLNKLISVYDGVSYDTSIGVSYSGQVFTFEKFNGQIYVGGSFKHIGEPIPNINFGIHTLARWDGTNFDSIGAFPVPNGRVNVLQVYNNELYIGGEFQNGAGQGISNLMKYDGVNFSAVGGGIVGNFTEVWAW